MYVNIMLILKFSILYFVIYIGIEEKVWDYEVIKKYRKDGEWNISNNFETYIANKLICDEKLMKDLHLSFLLVNFKEQIYGGDQLEPCIVWLKPNNEGCTQVLNLLDGKTYKINVVGCLKQNHLFVA